MDRLDWVNSFPQYPKREIPDELQLLRAAVKDIRNSDLCAFGENLEDENAAVWKRTSIVVEQLGFAADSLDSMLQIAGKRKLQQGKERKSKRKSERRRGKKRNELKES
jgi:hypothetical protein